MPTMRWQEIDIRWYTVAVSLLLSVYTILLPGIPNDDAYTYIRTADIFVQEGTVAAIAHYTWAGYSILIGMVSMLGLPLFTAAYIINALFYALLAFSFVSIVRKFDNSSRTLFLAALTILIFPELNENRNLIIRDTGFWSLSILGLWQFIEYNGSRQLKHGLGFCLALGLAALFRPEAIVYLTLTPFCLLLNSHHDAARNRKDLLRILAVLFALGVLGTLLLFLLGINLPALLLEFASTYLPFLVNAISPPEGQVAAMANAIFGEYASTFSRQYVTAVVAFGLLVILFMSVFYAISGPFFWLLAYGVFKRYIHWDKSAMAPLLAYALINFVVLFVFLYITRFLVSRYALVLAIMFATQLPFVVGRILDRLQVSQWRQLGMNVLVFFFFYCAVDSYISFGKPKTWLIDAANYVKREANPSTDIITNNHTIAYFSGKVEGYDQVLRNLTEYEIQTANPGDLFAIEMYYEMTVFVENESVTPYLERVAAFPNESDARVAIYRRVQPRQDLNQ